jgi:hypothetical protein
MLSLIHHKNLPIQALHNSPTTSRIQPFCFSRFTALLILPLDMVVFVFSLDFEICCCTNSILLKYYPLSLNKKRLYFDSFDF